jgi:hypothetical protein
MQYVWPKTRTSVSQPQGRLGVEDAGRLNGNVDWVIWPLPVVNRDSSW